MPSKDFIYGSKIIAQCQQQINLIKWKDINPEQIYLLILRKPDDFFKYWAKLRSVVKCIVRESPREELEQSILDVVGTNIDDRIIERNRVFLWTQVFNKKIHVPPNGTGHGKQQIIFNGNTFCARDRGVSWKVKEFSDTCQPPMNDEKKIA